MRSGNAFSSSRPAVVSRRMWPTPRDRRGGRRPPARARGATTSGAAGLRPAPGSGGPRATAPRAGAPPAARATTLDPVGTDVSRPRRRRRRRRHLPGTGLDQAPEQAGPFQLEQHRARDPGQAGRLPAVAEQGARGPLDRPGQLGIGEVAVGRAQAQGARPHRVAQPVLGRRPSEVERHRIPGPRRLTRDGVDQLEIGRRPGHGHRQHPVRVVTLEQDLNQPPGFSAPAAEAMACRKTVTSAPSARDEPPNSGSRRRSRPLPGRAATRWRDTRRTARPPTPGAAARR